MMDSPNRFDKENYVKLRLSRYRSEHDTPFLRGICLCISQFKSRYPYIALC